MHTIKKVKEFYAMNVKILKKKKKKNPQKPKSSSIKIEKQVVLNFLGLRFFEELLSSIKTKIDYVNTKRVDNHQRIRRYSF